MKSISVFVLGMVIACDAQQAPVSGPKSVAPYATQAPPSASPGRDEPAQRVDPMPEPADQPTSSVDGLYNCHRPKPDTSIDVRLAAGFSVEDVAAWLMGWSCRTVVVSTSAQGRVSRQRFFATTTGAELPALLPRVLAQLEVVAVSEEHVTVLLAANERLARGPNLIIEERERAIPANPGTPAVVDRAAKRARHESARAEIEAGITKRGPGRFELSRNAAKKLLAEPRHFARGARIVPAIKDGKPVGFKLYAIRPSSLFATLGFKNGDTITRVNGHDITTLDKAVEVYGKIRNSSKLRFEITRLKRPAAVVITIVER